MDPHYPTLMSSPLRFQALVASLLLVPALSSAQSLLGRNDSVYTWRGPLAAGAQLTVRNYNGPIDVAGANKATILALPDPYKSEVSGAYYDQLEQFEPAEA